METGESVRRIKKTLTFGLGNIKGYDRNTGVFVPLMDEQRQKVYREIRQGFKDFARLCNYTTALFYSSRILQAELRDLGYNTGYKPIVTKLMPNTHLNGMVLNQAFVLAQAHFAGEHGKSLMAKGESVLPTHKANGTHPLCFHRDAVSVIQGEDGHYYVLFHLLAEKWAKDQELPAWIAFPIKIKKRDKTGLEQLDKVIASQWQPGSGQLVRNRREVGSRYLARLTVAYKPDPYRTLDKETVMGIDLGVTAPAAIHIRRQGVPLDWSLRIGNGRALLASRNIVRGEIVRILRGLKRQDSPLHGAARRAATERLRELRHRERRILKTAAQRIAATIADQAKRHGAGVWQLEALLGKDNNVKQERPWLARNWAPGVVMDALRWQAAQAGAELRLVDPRYTSQRCSRCGVIDPANRPKGQLSSSFFACIFCGHSENADKNAARNLSLEGIQATIAATLAAMVPNGTAGVT